MKQEIERKFLLSKLPEEVADQEPVIIKQGYLSVDSGREIRVRARSDQPGGDKYYLTVKDGLGLSRAEVELALSVDQFELLWPLTAAQRLEKSRYIYAYGIYKVEIDVYEQAFAPLILAEVEFESSEASAAFTPPAWFGQEVTTEANYANAAKLLARVRNGAY